jgi:Tol biopolymer transport system component
MREVEARLESWKEIADYLHRDVRTVIRWEKERGLPVHRIPGQKRSGVYALRSELELWISGTVAEGNGANGFHAVSHFEVEPVLENPTPPPTSSTRHRKLWMSASVVVVSFGAAVALLRLLAGRETPRLANPLQITNDGRPKGRIAVTASSLFFVSRIGGQAIITRTRLNGEEPSVLTSMRNLDLLDASLDGSKLLVAGEGSGECIGPLWVIPTNGGPSRRLAGLCASTAAWSADGGRLAYAVGNELYLARSDGSASHRLITLPLRLGDLRWSPDSQTLRACLFEHGTLEQLWDVPLDGSGARRVLTRWSNGPNDQENAGRWTPDGKFFIFAATHDGTRGLWAIRDGHDLAAWRNPGPFQPAPGLENAWQPVPSKDGKKFFAIEDAPDRGELIRYEPRIRDFVAFPGMDPSSGQTTFSPDGKQVAYVSFPAMNLWKMNANGTSRKLLAAHAALPAWSPDGLRIAFMGANDGSHLNEPSKIYVISAAGGVPEQPVKSPEWQGGPSWTADSNGLIFGENGRDNPIPATCALHRFDFSSGKTVDLPNSIGLWTARTNPAGRYVAAVTRDNGKLVLYDLQTSRWTELASFADSKIGDNPSWSKDGRCIYFDSPQSPDPAIYRIRVPGQRKERVVSLKGIERVHNGMGQWIGLTPDNLPMVIRDIHSQEIYAWDWVAR